MFFDAVVAHDANYGIGIDNSLAWNLPEDMAFFKALTIGENFPEKKNIIEGTVELGFNPQKDKEPTQNFSKNEI